MWRKTEEPKPASPASPAVPPAGSMPAPASAPTSAGSGASATPAAAAAARPPVSQNPPQPTVRTIAGLTAEVVSSPGGVLTSSISIKGEIRGAEDLYVDGEIRGHTQLAGCRVTVGPHGRVFGDVDAREIVVRGQVQGALRGSERVEIGRAGGLRGDIAAGRISIEEGAQIHGKAEVLRGKEPAKRAPAEKPSVEVAQPVATD